MITKHLKKNWEPIAIIATMSLLMLFGLSLLLSSNPDGWIALVGGGLVIFYVYHAMWELKLIPETE